jgi:hypothetical protein
MNIYSISSGDQNPDYDLFGLQIAMDGDSNSTIRIYNSGTTGVIQYETKSDYIYSIQRVKTFGGYRVPAAASEVDRVGYPYGFAWVPGEKISSLCGYSQVGDITGGINNSGRLSPLTPKTSLNASQFLLSGVYVPAHHYDDPWSPSGKITVDYVSEVTSTRPPLITIENNDIATTGVINIQSTNHEGSIVLLAIRPDFTRSSAQASGNSGAPLKFGGIVSPSASREMTLREWNSLFVINDGCNANSMFRSGENRDTEFTNELGSYLDDNWHSKLEEHLWGGYINDTGCALLTRNSSILKNLIFYQLSTFGASDDLRALGVKSYPDANDFIENSSTLLRWHIGLGGWDVYSRRKRALRTELAWLAPLGKPNYVPVVGGLPPRRYCSYLVENNNNLVAIKSGLNTINPMGDSPSVPTSPY